jgi:GT2 family glycosyltransferase
MRTLEEMAPGVEVYSIDEAFVDLTGLGHSLDYVDFGQQIRSRIQQWIGMTVCVGIAPSKTLAKLANHAAKARRLILNNPDQALLSNGCPGQLIAQQVSRGRYVLFLNPDTELAPAALGLLRNFAEAHPQVGVVGPQLRYGDGSLQSSRRRFPTLSTFFLESTIVQRWWPRNRVLSRYYVLDLPDDATSRVDWVVGACMLVRRAVLEQIGGFDEGFFMYSEELDLCRRAVDAGWQVVYLPAAVVTHYEGKSSEQVVAARHIRFHSSRVRYVRKYHGRPAALVVRSFLLLTFILQWAEEAAKWLAGFILSSQRARQSMRRERMAAYGQVLRSGLRQHHSEPDFGSHRKTQSNDVHRD